MPHTGVLTGSCGIVIGIGASSAGLVASVVGSDIVVPFGGTTVFRVFSDPRIACLCGLVLLIPRGGIKTVGGTRIIVNFFFFAVIAAGFEALCVGFDTVFGFEIATTCRVESDP